MRLEAPRKFESVAHQFVDVPGAVLFPFRVVENDGFERVTGSESTGRYIQQLQSASIEDDQI